MRTRGLEPSAAATVWVTFGVAGAEGWAWGSLTGCCLPASTLVLGGLDVGKYLLAAHVQPRSTSALSTTARMRFLLSFTCLGSSRYWVVALAAPGVAAKNALQRHPSP